VVPQAEVKLPKRIPRTLQDLEPRKDITVGRPRPVRARRAAPAPPVEPGAVAPAPAPFTTVVHFVAPRRFRVRADSPRLDVELKADAILAFAGSREEATGTIEAIRGQAEPIGGRVFELERGKVTFNGGRIAAGALDVVARYDNPKAKVQAALEGTLGKPKLRLTSDPPLEEAQIAMLIATGRTDVKAGENGVSTLAGGDAGLAAAGAVVTGVFKDLLSDKLPVDSVSLDSTAVSAGKYLTDRIYVGYVRRFDAKPEKGENPDEVRIEYQLAPGWQVETRYGSGQSGSASIVWTKNY
jgi:translocation and assembly module TamB